MNILAAICNQQSANKITEYSRRRSPRGQRFMCSFLIDDDDDGDDDDWLLLLLLLLPTADTDGVLATIIIVVAS